MEKIQFKSKDLQKMVTGNLMTKHDEITEKDLLGIKQLTLNGCNLAGQKTDINLEDLKYFKSLEVLILSKVDVFEKDIEYINKLEMLKMIQSTDCKFTLTDSKVSLNLEKIVIEGQDLGILESIEKKTRVKSIRIRQNQNVDMQKITEFSSLQQLYIQNSRIMSEDKILDLQMLELLNLDGSKMENEDVIKKIKENIRVEFRRV